MASNLRDEHGNPIQLTDEHGNPVKLTDEHGNPMNLSGVAFTSSQQSTHGIEAGKTAGAYTSPTSVGGAYTSATSAGGTYGQSGGAYTTPTSAGGAYGQSGGAYTTPTSAAAGGGILGSSLQGPHTTHAGGPAGGAHRETLGDVLHGGGEEGGFGVGDQYQPRRDQTEEIGHGGGVLGEIQGSRTSPSSTSSEGEALEGEVHEVGAEGETRKKKGFTEKIKEKLTGGKHKENKDKDTRHAETTTVTSTLTTEVEHHEDQGKKGMMEKIKDKLPGAH